MTNGAFINAAARIEAAIASILEFAATTRDPGFIERITKLAIKKEIVLGLLLDKIGDVVNECDCSATVNLDLEGVTVLVNGVGETGNVTADGEICPSCFLNGSNFTFTFEDTSAPTNQSFTFVATSFQLPQCSFNADGIFFFTQGQGQVVQGMNTIPVQYSLQLTETRDPATDDSISLQIQSSQPVTNPFAAFFPDFNIPDSQLEVTDC